MTRPRVALSVLALLLAAPLMAAPYLRGVGAVAVNSQADIDAIFRELQPRGFNHVQASLAVNDPATPGRVKQLHDHGFTVYDYDSAFIDQPAPREDFQTKADGSTKTGTVCPRSPRRIAEMIDRCVRSAKVGADGLIWDFITVESWEDEACFCPACVGALNAALGREFTREQAAAAIAAGSEVRLVWRRVREESTTEALRQVCEGVHAALGDKPFGVGGYVLTSHTGLGMDTAAMYRNLDIGAPMIYQATGPAPLGWMRDQLRYFQDLGGKSTNVVCVDTGFFVKEPWKELLATSYDCMRGRAQGSCLWPFATVSQDDLEAMAVLHRFFLLVHEDAAGQPIADPAAGMEAFAAEHASLITATDARTLAGLVTRLRADPSAAYADDFAQAFFPVLCSAAEGRLRRAHSTDRIVNVAPYRVQMAADGSQLAISTPDWVLTQNAMAENIDEVVYRGAGGNAATGNANLGLLRARIIGWFDGWATRNVTRIVSQDADHITIRTSIKDQTCEIARLLTLRRDNPWIDCELTVTNLDSKPHQGTLWLWNGFGIPGLLEREPASPWADDQSTLTDDNVLTISDEGCHVSIAAEKDVLKLGAFGGDGTSHAYCELGLAPGEVFRTQMQLHFWRD